MADLEKQCLHKNVKEKNQTARLHHRSVIDILHSIKWQREFKPGFTCDWSGFISKACTCFSSTVCYTFLTLDIGVLNSDFKNQP